MKIWLIVLSAVLLTACNPGAMLEKIADAEKQKVAREYIDRLIAQDFEKLAAELDPALRKGNELEQLQTLQGLIPAGSPMVTTLVGYHVNASPGQTRYNVTYQFGYGDKWVVINAAWREKPGVPREIVGMSVTPLTSSLEEINAFTFKRATFVHYVFLAGVIAVPGFTLVTLVVCIRTKMPRRKWLWVLFILIGFLQFSLNWSTGELRWNLLYFQLLGAGVMKAGAYAPWILSVSLPLGAVAFWTERRALLRAAAAPPASPPVIPQPTP